MNLMDTSKQLICWNKNWTTNDRQKELLDQKGIIQIAKKGSEQRNPGVTMKFKPVKTQMELKMQTP